MLEGRRMFRTVLSPAGFPNFCHNVCPAFVGLVYTSGHCHTKPNITEFSNGTTESHFDLSCLYRRSDPF